MQLTIQSTPSIRIIRQEKIPVTPRIAWNDPFFTVEEDLFLVRSKCFLPLKYQTDTELCLAFRTKFQIECSILQLKKRFLQLIDTNPQNGILRIYLTKLLQNNSSIDIVTPDMLKTEFLSYAIKSNALQEILYSQIRTDHLHSTNGIGDMELIHLEIQSKRFQSYEISVNKIELRKCSAVIDRFLQHAADAANRYYTNGTLTFYPATAARPERLILTDDVEAYDNVACYNHMSRPIFERLVLFAKDQDAIERRQLIHEEYSEMDKSNHLCHDEINVHYATEVKRYVGVLDDARQRELARTTAFLEQSLKNDMEALQAMHQATLEVERKKIYAKYADRREDLIERIENERQHALELYHDSMEVTLLQLEEAVAVNTQQVGSVFGSGECLLQLLILAEDLECKKLRKSCVKYLTENQRFLQFALRRELTSPLLAEHTILSLLQNLSDQDAKELKDCPEFAFSDLLVREVHTRLLALTKQLEALPNPSLRDVMRFIIDKEESEQLIQTPELLKLAQACRAYPQVLSKELQRRRKFSSVKLDASLISNHVSLSDDDLVMELESAHRYCTAVATKKRCAGEFGRWMFEVRLEHIDPSGGSVSIGWEVPRVALQWGPMDTSPLSKVPKDAPKSPRGPMPRFGEREGYGMVLPGLTPGDDGKNYGILWQSEASLHGEGMGILFINGKQHSGVPCFKSGDVVGCALDQDATEPFVEFYLNGKLVIPLTMATAVQSTPTSSESGKRKGSQIKESIPVIYRRLCLQSANYALYPAATLFSSTIPNVRVRFNFRGNFDFPLIGYDPYGAELLDLVELAHEGGISLDPLDTSYNLAISPLRNSPLHIPRENAPNSLLHSATSPQSFQLDY